MKTLRRIAGNVLAGTLFGFAAVCACAEGPAAPVVEVCTLVLVSSRTGDTTRITNYSGPPIENIGDLAVPAWWEGCES